MQDNSLFKNTRFFVLDMDGTFYLGNKLIEGAPDFIEKLKASGRDYVFFTNNSSNNVKLCLEKLERMGFKEDASKIVISTHVTTDYLNREHPQKRVFLLGNERLTADFLKAGIYLVDDDPDIVVLGFDTTITYQKMWDAVRFLQKGALYIATHPDINCPTPDGYMPDTGSMMALFEASTGRRPLIMGKPMSSAVDYLTNLLACRRDELAFVGDRLATDIAIGANHGIPTALVLSGVTTLGMINDSLVKPDLTLNRLEDLGAYL